MFWMIRKGKDLKYFSANYDHLNNCIKHFI